MATRSLMAIFTILLVLTALVWGQAPSASFDSVDEYSVEVNSTDGSTDFSRGAAPRADYECPAVCPACPACPAHPGCPACPAAPPCPSAPACPRRIPPGYDYYEGLGYYKMHHDLRGWQKAVLGCEAEGGYLIVINSLEEANLVSTLMAKHGASTLVLVGFNDVTRKGKYLTVLGDALASTGYSVWAPGQPNKPGTENCGAFQAHNGFHDTLCSEELPSVCELDL